MSDNKDKTEQKSKFEQVMTRLDTFFEKFNKKKEVKLSEVKTTEDSTLIYDGELEVGTTMFIMVEENQVPLTEGSYELSGDHEGTTIVVDAEGKITEIVKADTSGTGSGDDTSTKEQTMSKEDRQKNAGKEIFESTIREVHKWDLSVSADTIEVGTTLIQVWDGEEWGKVDSGEYELENGDLIQVNGDGVVVMLTPKGSSTEGGKGEGDGKTGVTNEEMSRQLRDQETKLTNAFKAEHDEVVSLLSDVTEMLKFFGDQGSEKPLNKKFTKLNTDGLNDRQRSIMLSLQKVKEGKK